MSMCPSVLIITLIQCKNNRSKQFAQYKLFYYKCAFGVILNVFQEYSAATVCTVAAICSNSRVPSTVPQLAVATLVQYLYESYLN